MDIVEKSKQYALKCHRDTNHLYDGKPYEFHLEMVYNTALDNIHLIIPEHRDCVLAATWVHDVIEDCRQTYNDVLKATSKEVADIAFALTNEKGKNREERANYKYYFGINNTSGAIFVKICDRIANVEYSLNTLSDMYEKYFDEHFSFSTNINHSSDDVLFNKYKDLMSFDKFTEYKEAKNQIKQLKIK